MLVDPFRVVKPRVTRPRPHDTSIGRGVNEGETGRKDAGGVAVAAAANVLKGSQANFKREMRTTDAGIIIDDDVAILAPCSIDFATSQPEAWLFSEKDDPHKTCLVSVAPVGSIYGVKSREGMLF